MMKKHRNMSSYFMETFPTMSARVELATQLADAFPLPDGETLSSDYSPGVKNIAIWQACFHVQGGNRGLIIAEYFKNLVQLVLQAFYASEISSTLLPIAMFCHGFPICQGQFSPCPMPSRVKEATLKELPKLPWFWTEKTAPQRAD
jgi:hypothetical protein